MNNKKFSRIYIEISNVCNLQCDFCPEVERTKKVMTEDLFKNIIDQVKDLTEEITFHLMGEPLTHPKFSDFLDYCAEKSVPVSITTNGTLLNHKNRSNELLSPAVRQVNFSLQSFRSNFPVGDFNKYLKNIFDFTQKAFLERPDLYINYRLWNLEGVSGEESQAEENQETLSRISDEFKVNLKPKVNISFKKSYSVKNRLYIHFDSRFEWPSLIQKVSSERGFCYGLRSHIGIHADGTIVPCCLDKEAKIPLGQISAVSVLEAINSERARKIKEGFDKFEAREELCKRCSFIRRFDKKFRDKDVVLSSII